MGWASAGPDIFDPVARMLVDHVADPAIRQKVAAGLIATLQAGDWDTEDESLQEFADDPAIVAAFAEHGITLDPDNDEGEGEEPVNTTNDHLVGVRDHQVVIVLPPMDPMANDEAIRLAAWLVLCAGDHDAHQFTQVFEAVRST